MSRRHQLIIGCAVLCVAILAASWFLVASPRRADVAELKAQAETQQDANRQLQVKVTMLQGVAAKLPAQQARAQQLSSKIPADPALVPLIRQLSTAASTANVQLTGISPSKPAALAVAPGVNGIPVSLTVKGDYASIQVFELELEKLERAFLVTGLSLNGASGGSGASGASGASGSADAAAPVNAIDATITGQVLSGSPSGAPAPTPASPSSSATSTS
jgi:Tfp pilus assembly protein PilO